MEKRSCWLSLGLLEPLRWWACRRKAKVGGVVVRQSARTIPQLAAAGAVAAAVAPADAELRQGKGLLLSFG